MIINISKRIKEVNYICFEKIDTKIENYQKKSCKAYLGPESEIDSTEVARIEHAALQALQLKTNRIGTEKIKQS